jgi:hypothetical protein
MSPDCHRIFILTIVRNSCCLLMSAILPIADPLLAADGGPPEDPVAAARTVQLERLQRHAFDSDRADDKAPGLLLGNTRLGGCLAASGLGIPVLWSAELWSNSDQRLPLQGPLLSCAALDGHETVSYRQQLSLIDGLAKTSVRYAKDAGYDAEVFCSMADASLLTIRLTACGEGTSEWRLDVPATAGTDQPSPTVLTGKSTDEAFSRCAWTLHSDRPLTRAPDNRFTLQLAPGESVTLAFHLLTRGADEKAGDLTAPAFEARLAAHRAVWDDLWRRCAVLALPDPELERLWYRSLYWTLSTCGNERFLPGESMFAVPCWDMHPFTYGAAGWALQAFTAVGLPERAKAILDCHFKPAALRDNAQVYTHTLTGGTAPPEAMAFAHEVKTDGRNIPCGQYELQRHLDGFAATLFHRHQRFYPDQSLSVTELYPLMRGLAEFWCGLAQRDSQTGDYLLPKMTSLTEDLIAPHPIDAALAAKWCLLIAHRDAVALGRDAGRANHWRVVAEHLLMPQNDQRYLEFAGDPDQRGGGGYQGVRGFVYLGWPTMELMPTLDRAKALRTLDHTWERNRMGEGMIGFVANWFALADLHYGRGDHALAILTHNFRCEDAWRQGVAEFPGSKNYHFTTNYASYLLVPLAMAVQSADDRLEVFSAVPSAWKDFAFYQVPAESGLRVSGVLRDGAVRWVTYTRDGKVLRQATRRESLRIRRDGATTSLQEPTGTGP